MIPANLPFCAPTLSKLHLNLWPCMLVKLYVGPVTPWMWDMLQKLELNVDDRGMYYKYLVHEVYIPPKQKINVKNNLLV